MLQSEGALKNGIPKSSLPAPADDTTARKRWDDLAAQIGNILKQIRTKKNVTQASLSARTKIQRPIIARIESGKHLPGISTLIRVAEGLEVNPAKVLEKAYENVLMDGGFQKEK